jgi:hypothetical protein
MAIWISGFLGPIFLALAIPMEATRARLRETPRRFLADAALVLVSGVLAMTAGLAIVRSHNVWPLDWRLIVTLFGWALVLGGAARIVAPQVVDHAGGAMLARPALTRIAGAFWGLLGAFLTFEAYA